MIKTSCAKCIFAKRSDSGTQYGCSLGRLENYINQEKAILEGNSFTINTLCVACRSSDQFSITPEAMRKSLEISNTVIINGFEKNFWPSLKKLLNQTLIPTKIIVCVKEMENGFIEKYQEYQKYFNDKSSSLLIRKFFDPSYTFYQAINECANKCNTQFYTIMDGDSVLNDDYFKKIDILFNDKLEPIVCVLSESEYNNTFSLPLHFRFGGNDGMTLKEKILSLPEEMVQKGNIWKESML